MRIFNRYANNLSEDRNEYIQRIINSLKDNIIVANNNKSNDIFLQLIFFVRDDLSFYTIKNISIYAELMSLPSDIYPFLSKEFKQIVIEVYPIRFTENIIYSKGDEKHLEITYWGFLKLFKEIINERNHEHFNLFSKEIEGLLGISYDNTSNFNCYMSFAIVFWIIYLNKENVINIEDYNILFFENILFEAITENPEHFFNIYYKFENDASNGFLEIGNWEISKPPLGKVFFVLMTNTWLNFGFSILLLKYNILDYNLNLENIIQNDRFKTEVNIITENLEIIERDLEKWSVFLKMDNSSESFQQKKEKIIQFYSNLKLREDIVYYSKIAKTPLSEKKIKNFTNDIGNLWYRNAIVPEVLKFYNQVTFKENIIEKEGFGIFTALLKIRHAFIENNAQLVIGLNDFGPKAAKAVNKQFFLNLMKNHEIVTDNIKPELDRFLKTIKNKSKVVIFSNWRGINILNTDLEIEYTSNADIPFCNAKYRDIPIFNNYELNEYIFVIDLSSINYIIYTDKNWHNNELIIQVTEPTLEQIAERLNNRKDRFTSDKLEYTAEDIETLEKNSIYLKILFKFEMEIIKKAYKIFQIPK